MWKNVVDIVLIDFVTTSTKSSSSSNIFLKNKKIKINTHDLFCR